MNNRRRMTGFVTSDKMTKTVVVEVTRTYQHPLYKKVVHAAKRFKAHDELGAQIGDEVSIVESRPLSRDKHWVVEAIIRRQGEAAVKVEVTDVVEPAADAVSTDTAPADIAAADTVEGE